MAKKIRKRKRSAPKHTAPIELTQEEVRAAQKGRGTHKLPRERRDYSSVETASKVFPG
jgi:hypothetical protein